MPTENMIDIPDAQTDIQEEPKPGTSNLVLVSEILPDNLLVISLTERPVFPGIPMPLIFSGRKYVDAVNQAMESNAKVIGVALAKKLNEEDIFASEAPVIGDFIKDNNLSLHKRPDMLRIFFYYEKLNQPNEI